MEFTFKYDCNQQSFLITLEPVDKNKTFHRKLITKEFVDFLNRFYRPEPEDSPLSECSDWRFVFIQEESGWKKIAFEAKLNSNTSIATVCEAAEKLYGIAQRKLSEAIDDYLKMLAIIKIIQKEEA